MTPHLAEWSRNRNLVTPQNCRDSVPRAGAPIFRHVPLGRHIFFGTSYFALQQLFTLNHVSTSGFSCITTQARLALMECDLLSGVAISRLGSCSRVSSYEPFPSGGTVRPASVLTFVRQCLQGLQFAGDLCQVFPGVSGSTGAGGDCHMSILAFPND
jgi:hypothetical protein